MQSRSIQLALAAGVLLALIWFGHSYLEQRDDRVRFEAKAQVLEQQIKEREQLIRDIRKEADEKIDDLEKQKKARPAVREIVREIPQFIPQITGPVKELEPPVDGARPIPNAPSAGIVLDERQTQELRQFYLTCRQCEVDRFAKAQEIEQKDKIIAAKDEEVKAAKKAIQGGGFFTRLKRNAKNIALGIGIGVAVGVAVK